MVKTIFVAASLSFLGAVLMAQVASPERVASGGPIAARAATANPH